MTCASKKVAYDTPEAAEAALIQSHVRYAKSATGFYLCNDCQRYHLTSKGAIHTATTSKDIQKKIEKDREAQHWEQRFRRGKF